MIAANLELMFPKAAGLKCYLFRVTRGAKDDPWERVYSEDDDAELAPGSIIGMVTAELTFRKFAGVTRLQMSADTPKKLQHWIAEQLNAGPQDIMITEGLFGLADSMGFQSEGYPELRDPPHEPVTHPRLLRMDPGDSEEIFAEIRRGDILLHHPYHSFDSSTLHFLQSAAVDPGCWRLS